MRQVLRWAVQLPYLGCCPALLLSSSPHVPFVTLIAFNRQTLCVSCESLEPRLAAELLPRRPNRVMVLLSMCPVSLRRHVRH
jgi:hypothetical protein